MVTHASRNLLVHTKSILILSVAANGLHLERKPALIWLTSWPPQVMAGKFGTRKKVVGGLDTAYGYVPAASLAGQLTSDFVVVRLHVEFPLWNTLSPDLRRCQSSPAVPGSSLGGRIST